MGSLLATRRSPAPRGDQQPEIRFVPARWLVLLVSTAGLFLRGGKLGVVGLIWAFTPRALKIGALVLVATWTIVVLGAVAAIVLLALQLG